ncbi:MULTISPECIES: PAAR domain-containing protein [Cupriavidus]
MLRRIAVVHDRVSGGGTVPPYEGIPLTIHGHQAALIGGQAYCGTCKSIGLIAKAGGPRRMNLMTSEVALDSDMVMCKCATPQHIIAVLAQETWYEDMSGPTGDVSTSGLPATGHSNLQPKRHSYDQRFQILDELTGAPLGNRRYCVRTSAGIVEGHTDIDGFTEKVTSDIDESVTIEIY